HGRGGGPQDRIQTRAVRCTGKVWKKPRRRRDFPLRTDRNPDGSRQPVRGQSSRKLVTARAARRVSSFPIAPMDFPECACFGLYTDPVECRPRRLLPTQSDFLFPALLSAVWNSVPRRDI